MSKRGLNQREQCPGKRVCTRQICLRAISLRWEGCGVNLPSLTIQPAPGSTEPQLYLSTTLPVLLEIHAAMLTALGEGPLTSIVPHVTEHLGERGQVSWNSLEPARSQVQAIPNMTWLSPDPHPSTGEPGSQGQKEDSSSIPHPLPSFSKVTRKWWPVRAFSSFVKWGCSYLNLFVSQFLLCKMAL